MQTEVFCNKIWDKTGKVCNAFLGVVGPTGIVKFKCRKCKQWTEYRYVETDLSLCIGFQFVDTQYDIEVKSKV